MSQPPIGFEQNTAPRPSSGLAIASLVVSIVGFCVPLLGLVGVILGGVSLAGGSRRSGRGMALAGVIVGCFSLVFGTVLVMGGLLLPALGKARNSAGQLKSSTQLRAIGIAMTNYAATNKGELPEAGADWQARLRAQGLPAETFVSPYVPSPDTTDAYLYIPGFDLDDVRSPASAIIAYENPQYMTRGMINILMADGSVVPVNVNALQSTLDSAEKPGSNAGRTSPPASPAAPAAPKRDTGRP